MNRGIDLERELKIQSDSDRLFGASTETAICTIPMYEREQHLPIGEVQRGTMGDMMDCASRAPVNIVETYMNRCLFEGLFTNKEYTFLLHNGYIDETKSEGMVELSDAFIAIKSGTTKRGNSLKEPLQAIRDYGMVPKSVMPFDIDMTWDEYHNPERITPEIEELGRQFKELFTIVYERVDLIHFNLLLEDYILDTAGYAWTAPDENGVYHGTENMPNHAFMTFELLEDDSKHIFDNYKDRYDDDFIKHLASDYGFLGYGYSVSLVRQTNFTASDDVVSNLFISFLRWVRSMLGF